MKTMNFGFQLNSNDYKEANQAVLNRSSESEKRVLRNLALLIGFLFLYLAITSKDTSFLVVGVILVSLPVLCKIFVLIDVNIKMPIVEPTNCGEPITVEVIGEGLIVDTPSWQGTFQWGHFELFIETRKLLVIYPVPSLYPVSDSDFMIVPKRAFSGEEQLSDFREVLHKNIGKRGDNSLKKMMYD
ncbi:YcxB family protein [Lyngbya sp. CCAP 1446/10]|uniref:YcxB family protein n=1 Tax=Lyngbya sp. CCAP 1446/10 TaxID=439293 RepID=UPI0022380E5B|nr:YcxB family protein [Lyngbya sp. CCAP 1446/10]MCW6050462.1 YcxB family protein [Lyngbya sp. CCAP 1446/10]